MTPSAMEVHHGLQGLELGVTGDALSRASARAASARRLRSASATEEETQGNGGYGEWTPPRHCRCARPSRRGAAQDGHVGRKRCSSRARCPRRLARQGRGEDRRQGWVEKHASQWYSLGARPSMRPSHLIPPRRSPEGRKNPAARGFRPGAARTRLQRRGVRCFHGGTLLVPVAPSRVMPARCEAAATSGPAPGAVRKTDAGHGAHAFAAFTAQF